MKKKTIYWIVGIGILIYYFKVAQNLGAFKTQEYKGIDE